MYSTCTWDRVGVNAPAVSECVCVCVCVSVSPVWLDEGETLTEQVWGENQARVCIPLHLHIALHV